MTYNLHHIIISSVTEIKLINCDTTGARGNSDVILAAHGWWPVSLCCLYVYLPLTLGLHHPLSITGLCFRREGQLGRRKAEGRKGGKGIYTRKNEIYRKKGEERERKKREFLYKSSRFLFYNMIGTIRDHCCFCFFSMWTSLY